MVSLSSLIADISNVDFFNSVYDVRVLSYLIWYQKPATAKEISKYLEIPDSKVYPALNWLEENSMISKVSNARPNRYYFSDPYQLEKYLTDAIDSYAETKRKEINEIISSVTTIWDPDEPELGNIAYLFRGDDIHRELLKICNHPKKSIRFLISPSFLQYISTLRITLENLVQEDVQINISIPNQIEFREPLQQLIQAYPHKIKVKQTVYRGNSYVIRDDATMLSISHQLKGDVAILTNDELMVSNISQCWKDTNCCVKFNTAKLIDLEVEDYR